MDRIDDPAFELLGDLSTEDFQQKLYNWLEEKGTLPVIRTYLRHQLISTLKHTHPSSSLLSRKRNHLSPKVHALNLLVAEHLLEQNYHFTVSIFHSEEPHLGRPPTQFEPSPGKVDSSKYFQLKDVEDILGSLNLGLDTEFGKRVFEIYQNERKRNQSTSLLRALFQALCGNNFRWNATPKLSAGDSAAPGNKMAEGRDVSSAGFESHAVNNNIHTKVQSQGKNYLLETSPSRGDLKKHLIEWSNKEFEIRIKEEARKIREELEKETYAHKQKMKEDILSKQQQFIDLMNQLRDQQAQVKQHLKKIQIKEEELQEKEVKLEETQKQETEWMAKKHNDMVQAQQKLEEDFKRLHKDQSTMKHLQKEMEVWHNQILGAQLHGNSLEELNLMESLNPEQQRKSDWKDINGRENDITSTDTLQMIHSMRSLQKQAIRACQQTISELKDKNQILQTVANEQSSKINSLTSQASALSNHLEEAKAALRLLSSQDGQRSDFLPMREPVTVLSMPKSDENLQSVQQRQVQNEYAQERALKYRQSEEFQRKQKRQHGRSKYRCDSAESDSSTASSTTEEIIREARRRLERLEKESDEVDRQFLLLRHKQMSDKSVISGLGFHDPFPGKKVERELNLSNYDLVTAAQDIDLTVTPPYQLRHGSFSLQVVDGFGETSALRRDGVQLPANHALKRNQSHLSQFMYSSSADNFPQPPMTALGNASMAAGSTYNNNTKEQNSFAYSNHLHGVDTDVNIINHQRKSHHVKEGDVPLGNGNSEPKQTFNNDPMQYLQSQNGFHTKEGQHSVHFEEIESKRNSNKGHINEKNHLSAMKMGQDTINKGNQKMEERMQNMELVNHSFIMGVDKPAGNAFNNKTKDNLDVDVSPDQLSAPETAPPESCVTVPTPEDTSSPKLSVGIDDGKDDENSDLW